MLECKQELAGISSMYLGGTVVSETMLSTMSVALDLASGVHWAGTILMSLRFSEGAANATQRDVAEHAQHVQSCNDGEAVMEKQDV